MDGGARRALANLDFDRFRGNRVEAVRDEHLDEVATGWERRHGNGGRGATDTELEQPPGLTAVAGEPQVRLHRVSARHAPRQLDLPVPHLDPEVSDLVGPPWRLDAPQHFVASNDPHRSGALDVGNDGLHDPRRVGPAFGETAAAAAAAA